MARTKRTPAAAADAIRPVAILLAAEGAAA